MKNPLVLLLLMLMGSIACADNITRIGNKPLVARDPHGFCTFNGLLWFGAVYNDQMVHLYKTDGTAEGTQVEPLGFPGSLQNLTAVNGKMYFTTSNDMWYTTGSQLVHAHTFTSLIPPVRIYNFRQYKQYLVFIVEDLAGPELYAFDTLQQQVKTLSATTGVGFSNSSEYTIFNDKLYFPAGPGHHELWVSDLTKAGTHMVVDVNPFGASNPSNLTVFGNRLYFSAEDEAVSGGPTHHYKPWSTDGTDTGTHLLATLNPSGKFPLVFANAGSRLIFNVQDWGYTRTYASDGSGVDTLTTVLNLQHSFTYKGYVYCTTLPKLSLWRSDGTVTGTHEVVNFIHLSDPQVFTVYNGKLYFKGTAPGLSSFHPWSTDGSNSKQHLFPGIHGSPLFETKEFYEYNGGLYFNAMYDTSGYTLWKLDPFPISIPTVEEKRIELYPNPAGKEMVLNTPATMGGESMVVELCAISGQHIKQLYSGNAAPKLKLQLPDLSAGVYLVRVAANGQPLLQQQVMISQ